MRIASAFCVLLLAATGLWAAQVTPTSCTVCHGDRDLFGEEGERLVHSMAEDIHAHAGLSCHDCHGGNPSLEVADDPDAAMDEGYAPNPYLGAPLRVEHPELCGRCHSDRSFMRRFSPTIRVDQVAEYWTSDHGRALRQGDTAVATCIDCHGVHGILAAGNPESPVFRTHVAQTCGRCHDDPGLMEGRTTADGRPLPIDQRAKWERSVHARAMFVRGDLSAPTCNDCHGNHGAVPPGVESIAYVCGQCHGREAGLFRASVKHDGFEAHNEYLESVGPERCAACHQPPEHQAFVTGIHSFSECVSCHGNHGVVTPSVAMMAPLPASPCALCHEPVGQVAEVEPEPEAAQRRYEEARDGLLTQAQEDGLAEMDLFDWLVDRALELPAHTFPEPEEEGDRYRLRPEFARLFDKLRLGKTYYTYLDPVTGREVREEIVRCTHCHGGRVGTDEIRPGVATAQRKVEMLHELAGLTARAERILLRARRGGVETREPLEAIDAAIDAQISLQVLVHSFDVGPESAFTEQHAEGIEHAQTALVGGRQALEELSARHRGLFLSLLVIAAVLVALGLKIRQLSAQG